MFRKQIAILAVFFLLAIISLVYGSRALADLSDFDPAADAFQTKLILVPDTVIPANQEVELIAARPVIARRLDKLNLGGPYNLAIRNGQLVVTLPKDKTTPYVAAVITSVGEVVFVDGGAKDPPLDQRIELGGQSHPILFTSREVTGIVAPDSADGQIFYRLTLTPAATDRLKSFIETHAQSFICMAMDEQVLNCSTMYHQNGSTLELLPELTSSTALNMADLTVFLYSGPLSTRLKVISD